MFLCRLSKVIFAVTILLMVSVKVHPSEIGFSAEDYLSLANNALSSDANEKAIDLYLKGIHALTNDESLLTILSLETNLASAYSSIGDNEKAIVHYQKAISSYNELIDEIVDKQLIDQAKGIASQSSLFLGMVLQDAGEPRKALDAYGYAVVLDPKTWAALANLGSVLHDQLGNHDEALDAYNKAYEILTEVEDPTDAPEEPRFILSQLQYRIGLCLTHDPERKCALATDPTKEVSCKEMATHAFSLAVQYDPSNESAKHMLATITADATMKRASNTYVTNLFDDYAQNFEHSLVQELGYNGYEKLRRGFERAFGGESFVPTFSLVVDAGCGTGLVGEQFRNVSSYMIGVDLSQAILDEAEKLRPKLYDERIVGDITDVFREKKPISLIVAADSYIYFGDLDPLFDAMEDGMDDGAYAAFTLENVNADDEVTLDESKPDWRWQLTPSGRFAHRKQYVLHVAQAHHLALIHYETLDGFRYEHGRKVRGHLFVMQKKVAGISNDEL
ncbi:tetratricopeptide repeat protein [Nitzschia inconspicua]|uniref:Tetratricopeptide repeat protein n=1 Tax=Nitzschia inconspicua TaxID=303405 RepID=A0A9K3L538_9STRA|nr:tetratricopeptide repeat protein [Nitzschia inconspicua]